jgi:hypothetical protein
MGFVNARSQVQQQQVMSKMTKTASGAIEMTGDIQITGALEATSIGTSLLNTIFPIGSIYFTASAVNPSTSIGGSWERYAQGKCLFSVDDTDTDFSFETTGGVKEVVLTEAQMPSHAHSLDDKVRGAPGALWAGSGPYLLYDLTRTISTVSTPNTTHSRGSSQAHPNMPPYIAIYCWKRTS